MNAKNSTPRANVKSVEKKKMFQADGTTCIKPPRQEEDLHIDVT